MDRWEDLSVADQDWWLWNNPDLTGEDYFSEGNNPALDYYSFRR